MYTALVLTQQAHEQLVARFRSVIPAQYSVVAHHMTINMGTADKGPLVGSQFKKGDAATCEVTSYAYDDKVIAVGVQSNVPSQNQTKHITLAVNRAAGGKPFQSNQLTNWEPTSPMTLAGIIEECP
jgi:hypothetical protein